VGPDEVVLTVGDTKITAREFEELTQGLPPEVAGAVASMGKRGFAERYANLLSLAKEGEKRKLDQGDRFRQMMAFQRLMVLAQMTINQLGSAAGTVSAEEINRYYTAHQTDFQQIKVRGIYISFTTQAGSGGAAKPGEKQKLTEAEARSKAEDLRRRIQGGESIMELAKKESEYPNAAQGGDFGFVRRNQFPQPIDSAIFALEKTQISPVIRDRFGFYIFQAEDKRSQPLEEAKPVIENGLRQQKMSDAMTNLQTQNPVVYNPKYFGEPAPPPPPSLPAVPEK